MQELDLEPSSWRAEGRLEDRLRERGVAVGWGFDTRTIVRHIRAAGAVPGVLSTDGAAVGEVLERERPQALVPTLGGQTALNLAVELAEAGVLERLGVRLVGASVDAIRLAEDRERFRRAMTVAGLAVLPAVTVRSLDEGLAALDDIDLAAILRPSFTLGGWGGVAADRDEFVAVLRAGLEASPTKSSPVARIPGPGTGT